MGQLIDCGIAKKPGANVGETGKDDSDSHSRLRISLARRGREEGEAVWTPVCMAVPEGDVWSVGASLVNYLTDKAGDSV